MYCVKCGIKREESDLFCTNCGNKFETVNQATNVNKINQENKTASIVLGIIGIVCSLLIVFFPIGFVLSLVGLILAIINHKKVKNTSGIVLNSVGLGLSLTIMLFLMLIFGILGSDAFDEAIDEEYYEYKEYYDNYF